MEIKTPQISVLVACYNNQHYIKETITSIFRQSYPNIEIIIGDDGSKEFDEVGLREWIEQSRTPNITNVNILANKLNQGTVANIEHMQRESSGEYMFNIAADDILYDENVLNALYKKAEETGSEFIIAQTEMWDHELKTKIGEFISAEDIEFIKRSSASQIYEECCCRALLPASYLYKKTLLGKIGNLSEKYRLVEDYPFQLRATRLGIKPVFADIKSTIKHRDGGISHGHKTHTSRTVLIYYRDCIWSYINEVLPYEDLLSEKGRERARLIYLYSLKMYKWIYYPDYLQGIKNKQSIFGHINKFGREGIFDDALKDDILEVPLYQPYCRNILGLARNTIKVIVYLLTGRRALFKSLAVTLGLFAATCLVTMVFSGHGKFSVMLMTATFSGMAFLLFQMLMGAFLSFRHRRLKN